MCCRKIFAFIDFAPLLLPALLFVFFEIFIDQFKFINRKAVCFSFRRSRKNGIFVKLIFLLNFYWKKLSVNWWIFPGGWKARGLDGFYAKKFWFLWRFGTFLLKKIKAKAKSLFSCYFEPKKWKVQVKRVTHRLPTSYKLLLSRKTLQKSN